MDACDSFCKSYSKKYNTYLKKLTKKYGKPYVPSKERDESTYKECQRYFCNPSCDSYNKKFIKNRFHKNYKTKKVKELKKKGALSGCVHDLSVYPN